MRIPFDGKLNESQFRRIHHLAMGKLRYFGFFLVALPLLILMTGGYRPILDDPREALIKGIPFLLLLLLFFVGIPYFVKRAWKRNKLVKLQVTGSISDEGFEWKTELTQSKFPWNVLLKRRESKDLVLLYSADNQAFFFPREFFQDEEGWNEFKKLVVSKLPPK